MITVTFLTHVFRHFILIAFTLVPSLWPAECMQSWRAGAKYRDFTLATLGEVESNPAGYFRGNRLLIPGLGGRWRRALCSLCYSPPAGDKASAETGFVLISEPKEHGYLLKIRPQV